jgi:hypothetical protein
MFNYYEVVEKDKEISNPNYETHKISLLGGGFRMIINSGSGTGKTNSLLYLISLFSKTFQHIDICVKSKNEKLYEHLDKCLNTKKYPDTVSFYEDGEIPDMKNDGLVKLIVYDDLLFENQSEIKKYYIYSRKKNYSNAYLSQQFHKIPLSIRQNTEYFIFGKNMLKKDLDNVHDIMNTDQLTKPEFRNLYTEYTKAPLNVILIDLNRREIRHNITDLITKF